MARLFYFAIFALFAVLAKAEGEFGNSIEIIEDVQEFLSKNPEAKLVPLQRAAAPRQTIHYNLGNRTGNDRIVAQGNKDLRYPTPQDIQLGIRYPKSGSGAVVSFVDVWVDQTSNIGNAYVVSGGIGQRQISIVIEAKRTTLLSYRVAIYGY